MNTKMLISILIMSVFTIGAGLLLFSTPLDDDPGVPVSTPSLTNPEDDINNQESLATPPPAETPPPATPGPDKITGIEVLNEWGSNTRFDITLDAREKVTLKVVVAPEGVVEYNNMVITWSSSDADKIAVSPMMVDGRYWEATIANLAGARGTETVTVTIGDPDNGGMSADVKVHHKG